MSSEAITKNDLKGILESLAGASSVCIVDSGIDGEWYYKKYSDGTYDAYMKKTTNVACNTASGNLYVSATQTVNLPSWVTQADNMIFGTSNGEEWIRIVGISSSATPSWISFQHVRTTSRSAATRAVSLHAHGTWDVSTMIESGNLLIRETPCAHWTSSSTTNLSATTGTAYSPNQFGGHTCSITTNNDDVFESDANGIKVKKTGWYLFAGSIHCNAAGNGNVMSTVLYNYDTSSNLTLPFYMAQPAGYSSHHNYFIVQLQAGHRVIFKITRYSGSQAFRPTSTHMYAAYLSK